MAAAHRIRAQNEKMAGDLQRWATEKLFTLSEVKMIAKKKTNFEYITSASNAEIVDFLRYIKFETDLDKLLQARLKKHKKNRDFNYARGIGMIYLKATNKFHDKNLFILYINFCLERKMYSSAKSAFTRGLRIFATEPEMWIMAANFEYDINHNITAARVLLQMALRFNPASEHIWTTFFAIELKYWDEMVRRKAENNMNPLEADTKNSVTVDGKEAIQPLFEADTPFLECAIPRLVYTSAIKSLPQNYHFRAQFLEIARKFLNTDELIKMIASDISETFPLNGEALAVHADLQLRFSGNFNKQSYVDACQVFEKALEKTKSGEVWDYYIKYIRDKLASLTTAHAPLVKFLTSKLFEICEKATPSPATYLTWIDALISTGRGEEANKIVNRSIKKFPKNSALRLQKIEILIKSGQPKGKILNSFERAVKKADASAELWYRYVQWMALNEVFDASTKLTAAELDDELSTTQPDQALVSVCTRCLKSLFNVIPETDYNTLKINLYNTIFFQFGILAARQFLENALKTPPHSLAFCAHALAIEEAQPKEVFAAQVVRQVYEAAVREHGSDPKCEEVWLRYIKFEQNQTQITRAGDIYWRAKKALKDPASFMAKYEQIKH